MPASSPPFRQRLVARERLVGNFVKTPTPYSTDLPGDLGLDVVVIDEEHGPFDRGSTEVVILAARASGTAAVVRVAEARASCIPSALDGAAAGVLVPHVSSAATARKVAAATVASPVPPRPVPGLTWAHVSTHPRPTGGSPA